MKARKQGMTAFEAFSGSLLHSESAVDKILKELGFSASDEQDEQIPSMLFMCLGITWREKKSVISTDSIAKDNFRSKVVFPASPFREQFPCARYMDGY